jgi:general secretion pathway protein C
MRLALDPRAQRLLRRVPRTNVYTVAELALLSLLAIQCARLVWTIVTPLGPVGEWAPAGTLRTQAVGRLDGFDPFFRLSGDAGPVVVTALELKLFGVRQDQASGRGSAIIATPDGTQRSYAVGDEIMPGAILAAVAFDSVTIARGGNSEQLFMDQSQAAQVALQPGGTGTAPTSTVAPPPPPPPTPPGTGAAPGRLAGQIALQPRLNGSRLTGIVLSPQGTGEAFRSAGLLPGDVLVEVNGQRLTSPDQLGGMRDQLASGSASVKVERGGRVVRLQLRNGQ